MYIDNTQNNGLFHIHKTPNGGTGEYNMQFSYELMNDVVRCKMSLLMLSIQI